MKATLVFRNGRVITLDVDKVSAENDQIKLSKTGVLPSVALQGELVAVLQEMQKPKVIK